MSACKYTALSKVSTSQRIQLRGAGDLAQDHEPTAPAHLTAQSQCSRKQGERLATPLSAREYTALSKMSSSRCRSISVGRAQLPQAHTPTAHLSAHYKCSRKQKLGYLAIALSACEYTARSKMSTSHRLYLVSCRTTPTGPCTHLAIEICSQLHIYAQLTFTLSWTLLSKHSQAQLCGPTWQQVQSSEGCKSSLLIKPAIWEPAQFAKALLASLC